MPSSVWQAKVIDWKRKLLEVMLVIKDGGGNPVDDRYGFGGKWDGSPDFSLYFPMTVRFTAVAVAKGAAYNPAVLTWRLEGMHVREVVHLKAAGAAWERGQLGAALAAAERELESNEPARAEEARKIAGAFKGWAAKRRKEIEALKTAVPDAAPALLARLGQSLGSAALGKELLAEAKEWEKDPAVLRARKARPLLDGLLEIARRLRGKGKATDPEFARRYEGEIRAILQLVARLKKEFPDTPSFAQAAAVASGLGIRVPE